MLIINDSRIKSMVDYLPSRGATIAIFSGANPTLVARRIFEVEVANQRAP